MHACVYVIRIGGIIYRSPSYRIPSLTTEDLNTFTYAV